MTNHGMPMPLAVQAIVVPVLRKGIDYCNSEGELTTLALVPTRNGSS